MTDMEQSLQKLIGSMFIRYRNYLIDPRSDGFYWSDTRFETLELAKAEIDKCYGIVGDSIITGIYEYLKNKTKTYVNEKKDNDPEGPRAES